MSTHTPGPWALSHVCGGNYTVLPESHKKHASHAIASVHENHGEENAANARLIAAAPELLEALKVMKVALRQLENMTAELLSDADCRELSKAHNQARAAIAKAEGSAE